MKTLLFNISSSRIPSGNTLITSSRIENLEVRADSITNKTNISLNIYDRLASNRKSQFNLTLPGNWSYISSSNLTLSCNLLYNQELDQLAFVKFNDSGLFKIGQMDPRNITTYFYPSNFAYSLRNIQVGKNCQLFQYKQSYYSPD